jgi:formate dehydrogenase major subunit
LKLGKLIGSWPPLQQLDGDSLGLGRAAGLRPRTESAERIAKSVCPFCAVGGGQLVYVKDVR